MKDFVCLIPNWLMATHAVHAADSLRKFYPDMPIYFVDDINTREDMNAWPSINRMKGGMDVYDADSSKLITYPNSAYILRKHDGHEAVGHGNAITHAMKFIHSKWVLHMHADARVIKEGIIEYMMEGTNNRYCGIGDDNTKDGPINLDLTFSIFRGDLYHKYNLDFLAHLEEGLQMGTGVFPFLRSRRYKTKIMSLSGYMIHLADRRDPEWERYY